MEANNPNATLRVPEQTVPGNHKRNQKKKSHHDKATSYSHPLNRARTAISVTGLCWAGGKAIDRVKVLVDLVLLVTAGECRSHIPRNAGLAVIREVRACKTLATSLRKIDDELRHGEARDRAPDARLQVQNGLQGRPQMFDALDHVALVDVVLQDMSVSTYEILTGLFQISTYWRDVVVRELTNERAHRLDVVVDAAQQDSLVAHSDALLQQALARELGDPADLVWMVDVRVQSDTLAGALRSIRYVDQRREPAVTIVQEASGSHGQPLGRETEAADVGHANEALADLVQLVGFQVV